MYNVLDICLHFIKRKNASLKWANIGSCIMHDWSDVNSQVVFLPDPQLAFVLVPDNDHISQ